MQGRVSETEGMLWGPRRSHSKSLAGWKGKPCWPTASSCRRVPQMLMESLNPARIHWSRRRSDEVSSKTATPCVLETKLTSISEPSQNNMSHHTRYDFVFIHQQNEMTYVTVCSRVSNPWGYPTDHLVGGLEHFFFHILGMSSSQLTFMFFRGVGIPPTSHPLIIGLSTTNQPASGHDCHGNQGCVPGVHQSACLT